MKKLTKLLSRPDEKTLLYILKVCRLFLSLKITLLSPALTPYSADVDLNSKLESVIVLTPATVSLPLL